MKVPMSSPDLNDSDTAAVMEVLETRYLSIGPKNQAFEIAMADYVGVDHAVTVNSGTSALHLAVIAADVQAGDLVITTPFSFIASANCVLFERAVPIFVDIDPETYNIDPWLVNQAAEDLKSGGQAAARWLPPAVRNQADHLGTLKAILPVDAFGQAADYDRIRQTAEEHEVIIIEDSCEALGTEYKGKKAGTLGDIGAFAFYPNKQMTTGEGGILVTDNQDWADLFRSLRNQGRDVFDAWLNHTRLGFNYRLDEMSAALGLTQLERIEQLIQQRSEVAGWYNQRLQDLPGIRLPQLSPDTTRMSWFVYVIQTESREIRNSLLSNLKDRGIPSRPYFTPIHLQPFYREKFGYQRGDYPETEKAGDCCLALPFSGVMGENQVEYVVEAIQILMQ